MVPFVGCEREVAGKIAILEVGCESESIEPWQTKAGKERRPQRTAFGERAAGDDACAEGLDLGGTTILIDASTHDEVVIIELGEHRSAIARKDECKQQTR